MTQSTQEDLIKALTQLLDEEEKQFAIVRQKLIEIGAPAKPALRKVLKDGMADGGSLTSERAAEILETIRFSEMEEAWVAFAQKDPPPLEEGLFLLAQVHAPDRPFGPYRKKLDQMAQTLQERLADDNDPRKAIEAINQYLFRELGFSGNRLQYYLPENSYIHTLLDRKRGIPISLSALMLLLAERLRLPLYGIGLPGHFLIQWSDPHYEVYIDPYNEGKRLTREEIASYLEQGGTTLQEAHLQKVGARQILTRMMRNLIHIYSEGGETERAKWLTRFEDHLRSSGS